MPIFTEHMNKNILEICCCPGTSKLIVGRCQTTRLMNMWPFWSALVGNHWNLQFSTETSRISHPKKKHPEVRGVRNHLCYLAWSFQKHSRCRCVSKCSRVSCFFFGIKCMNTKKIHLCFVLLNESLTGKEPLPGLLKSSKASLLKKSNKRPNSCAFGSGKLSDRWREQQLALGNSWNLTFWNCFSSWWPSSPRAETISRGSSGKSDIFTRYRLPTKNHAGGEKLLTTPWRGGGIYWACPWSCPSRMLRFCRSIPLTTRLDLFLRTVPCLPRLPCCLAWITSKILSTKNSWPLTFYATFHRDF